VLASPPTVELAASLATHPGLSSVQPLINGADALHARLQLAREAKRSLDIQYYLYHPDGSGKALAVELRKAADRGVRVRLLLDDIRLQGADELLVRIDKQENIEVRIFNPFAHRSARWLDFLRDFGRVNHRMHNKSMSADGLSSIVGGRNIGDEYFAAKQTVNFSDMDLLISGPVVREIGATFDEYWNSAVVYPISELSPSLLEVDSAEVASSSPMSVSTVDPTGFPAGKVYWAKATAIADPPDKLHEQTALDTYAIAQLRRQFNLAQKEMILVSPYFVPGRRGVKWLADAVKRGVRVRVLTNSFAATDVSAVHAGYARYRAELLRAGVELYELKPATPGGVVDKAGAPHSSRASLHAKVYLVDGHKVFVGSMNLDPRSVVLNTEMGVVVDSAPMYRDLMMSFERSLPSHAWRLELADPHNGDGLIWIDSSGAEPVRLAREPGLGPLQSLSLFLFGLLPVEPQL
jgi:putative cardiolipin synthase